MSNTIPLEDRLKKGKAIILRQSIELQFQDTKLQQLQESNRQFQLRLTESAGKSGEKRKLRVVVEGIHTGLTKNQTFYPGNALEESVPTWTDPHKKPVLKNHSVYTEPLGRIVKAEYGESILTDKYTVRLTLELTDQDAIDKVLDGRYLTLSVGGSASKVTCNICAKDLVSEGFCGHYRGRTYEGKKAHWIIGNYTGEEISFVNMPADVFSQVIAAELVSEGGKPVGKPKENGDPSNVNENDDNVIDNIDNLLNNNAPGSTDPEPETPQNLNENEDDNIDNGPPAVTEGDEGGNGNSDNEPETPVGQESVEDLKRQLQEANAKVATLEDQLTESEAENTALTAQVAEKSESVTTLTTQLEETKAAKDVAESESKTFKEQNIALAKFARKTLAERVVDLQIHKGLAESEKRDELVTEWTGNSMKVLQQKVEEFSKVVRQPSSVPNPGYVVDNNDVKGEDGDLVTEGSNKPKKPVTYADFAEQIIKSTVR